MVCEWGMSDLIGPLTFGKKDEEVFLGKEISKSRDFSEQKSIVIDDEITRLVKNAEKNATHLLNKYIKKLHEVSSLLLQKETIDRSDFENVVENGLADNIPTDNKDRVRRRSKK